MEAGTGQRRAAPGEAAFPPCPRGAPAVVAHTSNQARAALELADPRRGVVLLSAPGAAGNMGAAWFLALVAQAADGFDAYGEGRSPPHPPPQLPPHWVALDCGSAPGYALAALRAGARLLVLDRAAAAFPAVAAAAAEAGAEVWAERPPALDLGRLDLRRAGRGRMRLAEWLTGGAVTAPGALG
jgi:DNA-binding NarL/FixJ family response regulator